MRLPNEEWFLFPIEYALRLVNEGRLLLGGRSLFEDTHLFWSYYSGSVHRQVVTIQQVSLWSGSLKFDVLDCDNPISNGPISLMHISL